jgi:C4-dicarboxylate-specific signal transduction histidine kinase/CheY-like chemotaxis protein
VLPLFRKSAFICLQSQGSGGQVLLFRKRKPDDVIRFHTRHAAHILIAFSVLLSSFFLLLATQYNLNAEHEKKILFDDFQECVAELDSLLASVTMRVEGMRIQAEADLMEIRLSSGVTPPLAYRCLKEAEGGARFHLDDFGPPIARDQIGNLTGLGSLIDRDPGFYGEVYMALHLNPRFRAISKAIQDAAWIYYTSAKDFINIFPWVSSGEFKFSKDLLTHEFFTLGTPDRNPDRKLFWTEVYVDEYGKGLMTTCAAPVYDENLFLGTVAIDLTVDFLNSKLRKFQAERGIMFLVNDRNQLLAHPFLITSGDKRTRTMVEALPERLRPMEASVAQAPEERGIELYGYTVLRSKLLHAPWQAYYVELQPSMWDSLLSRIGLGALILLAGLFILVIIILTVTHRNFVAPSGKLVNFIMAMNRRDFTADYQDVPQVWKPWFRTIENTFRENDELAQKIRRQNEELEQRITERTAKLSESNQQLLIEIEERKQAENEKQRLQAQLQRAQKMEAIGILVSGVAHDLNNVLAGLVSYPELLLMGLDRDSPIRGPLLTIQKSGERAAAIVQDLLTLARRGVAATEVVNLNALIREYLKSPESKELRLRHPQVKLKTQLETDLLSVEGSPVHLCKCVTNLVINAAEAMPQGGQVLISTANQYVDQPVSGYDEVEEGDYVTLTVADSGIGISPEDLERIFEPFYTKKIMGRSGTGLGMAVVWGTVKDHQGYIDVRSTPGRGTTFSLYFPATRKEAEKEGVRIDLNELRGKGERILIVDDVLEQREIGARILQRLGYTVDVVSSGEEAVAYMQDHSPDLILLDMIMDPGMDGLETYQRILSVRPGQKAIIASGFAETDRVRKVQRLGAGAFVKKPFLIEKIAVAVRKELEK